MSHQSTDGKPRVIIAHPGTQHSHFLATEVQKASMLGVQSQSIVVQFPLYKRSNYGTDITRKRHNN